MKQLAGACKFAGFTVADAGDAILKMFELVDALSMARALFITSWGSITMLLRLWTS
jgi:hypothetical protein